MGRCCGPTPMRSFNCFPLARSVIPLNYTRTIICLANSRKISGRCIAGKVISDGMVREWIRPVSSRPSGEISEEERRFENGTDPTVRDIITVPMVMPSTPWLSGGEILASFDSGLTAGQKHRVASFSEVQSALDHVENALWINSSSGYNGINDRVAEQHAENVGSSLKLIEVHDLEIRVGIEGAQFVNPRRKVRGMSCGL